MYKTRISTNTLLENVIKDILLSQSRRIPVVTPPGAGLTQWLPLFHWQVSQCWLTQKFTALPFQPFPPALWTCPASSALTSGLALVVNRLLGSHTPFPRASAPLYLPCSPLDVYLLPISPLRSHLSLPRGWTVGPGCPLTQPNSNSRILIF